MNILQVLLCLFGSPGLGLVSYIHNCAAVQGALDERMRDASPALRIMIYNLDKEIKTCLDCTKGIRMSTLEQEVAPPGLYWRDLRIHPRTGAADASLC